MSRIAPRIIAGWLFLFAAVLCCGTWFIYLFVAMPENLSFWASVTGQLRYTFSEENPHIGLFVWLVVLPLSCVALGLIYLLNGSGTQKTRQALFAISAALAVASFALNNWSLAFFVALPTFWGYRAIQSNT